MKCCGGACTVRQCLSQSAFAKELGIGLESIDYWFQVSVQVEKGLIKMQDFSQSKHKLGDAYLLTPVGIAKKSKLTARFLKREMAQYEALQSEIQVLKSELVAQASVGESI